MHVVPVVGSTAPISKSFRPKHVTRKIGRFVLKTFVFGVQKYVEIDMYVCLKSE